MTNIDTLNPLLKLVLATALTTFLIGCGGGGDSGNGATTEEEANTETSDREDIALQGTVLKFAVFQSADGTQRNADTNNGTNFIFLAPFKETFTAEYGCANISGSYLLSGNTLSMTEQSSEAIECTSSGAAYEANLEITRRVVAGPSTVSVANGQLTLTTGNNEALVLIASEEG